MDLCVRIVRMNESPLISARTRKLMASWAARGITARNSRS